MIDRISNFIDCRISNFKRWYVRKLISTNVRARKVAMDIGSGNTVLNYVNWDVLYRVDPTLIVRNETHDIKGTWEDANVILSRENIDCVFLMDVIEHLQKREALRLLKEIEHHVKHIVVFTPHGFMSQEDGDWNTHRSGWIADDFGDGWNTWVIKNYHTVDFKGRKLNTPVDALLAIYTKS